MSLIDDLKEQEKQDESRRAEKRFKNLGKKGKILIRKIQKRIFRDDILQPFQSEFKNIYHKTWKERQLIYDAQDRHEKHLEKDLDEAYAKKKRLHRNTVTLKEKILKDIHLEHPTMMSESDIIKHEG